MKLKYDIRITYYDKNIIRSFSYYKDDKIEGEYIGYNNNGVIGIKYKIRNGDYVGNFILFDNDGTEFVSW